MIYKIRKTCFSQVCFVVGDHDISRTYHIWAEATQVDILDDKGSARENPSTLKMDG